MSGGAYDYAYLRVLSAAEQLREYTTSDDEGNPIATDEHTPYRLMLAEHLGRVAMVLKAVEWADSYDTSWDNKLRADIEALCRPTPRTDDPVSIRRAGWPWG